MFRLRPGRSTTLTALRRKATVSGTWLEGEMKLDTNFVHAAVTPEPKSGAILTPLFLSTTFIQESVEKYLDKGYSYSRTNNPTVTVLEQKLAKLENGYGACAFGTGMAATTSAISATMQAGDHCVISDCSYGGTNRSCREFFTPMGMEFTFVDFRDPENVKKAMKPNTKLVFSETPANPVLSLTDIEAVSKIAKDAGAKHVVDATFATPVICRPLDWGADMVIQSLTKYYEGHNIMTGGAVISKDQALHEKVKWVQNVHGNIINPFAAYIILQTSKTMHLRMRKQSENAMAIASFLEKHPKVTKVVYPGLASHPQKALADKYHRDGLHGGMLWFDIVGGSEAGTKLMNVCQRPWSLCENLGATESIITACAVMTHANMLKEDRLKVGITDGFIRISCGIEDSGDSFDGLFLSNGPGDPTMCAKTVEHVKYVMKHRPDTPIFGICLGNQILALAAGASTYKMRFGNRGMNQPVVDLRTQRCYITAQNHGFAVDQTTLPQHWVPLMVNANDGTNEGIIHSSKPWFSVQFHPEAKGGPTDTDFLFNYFLQFIAEPTASVVTTMPYSLPTLYRKVLVLGSGGLTIGQAGEFDYSGSQAIKALKEAGVMSILINPNIATVQTSAGMADRVYFLPVTPEFVVKVIEREKPDGIFAAFGGQTALNCAVKLYQAGVFEKYNVKVLGTQIDAIMKTEDRDLFSKVVDACGEKIAESSCCDSVPDAVTAAEKIGYPVLVRAAYALGGLGSGFAYNEEDLKKLVNVALVNSPQVIIDKSLKGWKELEYEVVRDKNDNCITVCNMENFDPMGVHTGESIVIAPSQTLSNDEYYRLRQCALKIIRHLGIVGECNIQYAVDPHSSEFRIIEVNARLSRSSALASKATGYPLAYVAAKLALGHDLVQLRNSVTRCTTACFEPSLDYVVAKVPRWDLQKFSTEDARIGSAMQSVGEVMAIGRTFEETIQKALRMVDETSLGFDPIRFDLELNRRGSVSSSQKRESAGASLEAEIKKELAHPTPVRMWAIAKAFEHGMNVEEVHELTSIDRWFLSKLHGLHMIKGTMKSMDFNQLRDQPELLKEAKLRGFSDRQIAALVSEPEKMEYVASPALLPVDYGSLRYTGGPVSEAHIRHLRKKLGIVPVVKQIDTLAAEYPAETNYLYLTYSGEEHDVDLAGSEKQCSDVKVTDLTPAIPEPLTLKFQGPDSKEEAESRIIVLGCGPYRIGSSVEFDWCSVSCVRTLRSLGHKAIVINCNPETVSTDFDESNRLFFEELSHERVMDISELETPRGLVVSVGGQTPNNLALGLHRCGIRILGTSVEANDACEDRNKFSQLCDRLRVDQPEWSEFATLEEARRFCTVAGYPVLVRPSYVLSGAAMRVVTNDDELDIFLKTAAVVSRDHPVVISKYITGAKEVEMDAIGNEGELVNYAIAEHIENAGVHSGDATLLLPAQRLFVETHRRVKSISQKLCKALKISGPFNIQFICKDNEVKVIECNLRASRSMPFISKTYNVNFIELATRIMTGFPVHSAIIQPMDIDYVACKCPMFSFGRLKNSDPRLGVEMSSTGEVACFGVNVHEAFLKGMLAANFKLPKKNIVISLGPNSAKHEFVSTGAAKQLQEMGFSLFATKSTSDYLSKHGVSCSLVYKPLIKKEPNVLTLLQAGKMDMMINVPDSMDSNGMTDGFKMRRGAIEAGVPLITDIKTAIFTCAAIHRKWLRESSGKSFWDVCSWQEYVEIIERLN